MALVTLTALTLLAFAANSLLCRMALGTGLIDPASFTAIRLASGALILIAVSGLLTSRQERAATQRSWASAFALFSYATAFSLAYITLDTGMGALLLFGAVQVTMIVAALRAGERLSSVQWCGSAAAIGGLIYLVLPGLSAPDPLGATLMTIAGIAWGIYSIRGKGVASPVALTASNFLRATPMTLLLSLAALPWMRAEPKGVLLAMISGAITSGLGYVLWYRVLRGLTTTQASIVQLLVPVIAAFGGVAFLSEHVSWRLLIGSAFILGGVGVTVTGRRPRSSRP